MASSETKPDTKTKIVKVNFANDDELQTLPTVGPSTSRAIIEHRVLVGNITPETFGDIMYVKKTLMKLVDFEPNAEFFMPKDDDDDDNTKPQITSHDDKTQQLINNIGLETKTKVIVRKWVQQQSQNKILKPILTQMALLNKV